MRTRSFFREISSSAPTHGAIFALRKDELAHSAISQIAKTPVSAPYDDKKHINTLFPSFLSRKFFDTLQIIHTFATKIEQNLGAHGLFRPTTADLLSISRKSFILLHNS